LCDVAIVVLTNRFKLYSFLNNNFNYRGIDWASNGCEIAVYQLKL